MAVKINVVYEVSYKCVLQLCIYIRHILLDLNKPD
jgi:hypothetical protein